MKHDKATDVKNAIRASLGTLAALCLSAASAAADCPLFSAALESAAGVADNGGTVNGSVSFTPAVVGNGACFGAGEDVSYPSSIFDAGTGSVSFWFKRNMGSGKGGILEIETLGTPNSLGIFYNTLGPDVTLFVELSTDVASGQISAANVLPDSSYVHIAVTWEDRGGNAVAKLFVDGVYVGFVSAPGSFAPSGGELVVGKAGVFPWYGSAIGCIDELAFFDFPMLDSEVYAEYVVSDDRQDPQQSARPVSTGPVKIVDGSLEVNDEPFVIKGVGYQPIPIGSGVPNTAIYSDACILDRDIPLIRAMNANTIRLWATLPITEALLDRLWNGGVDPIYAIMSFWIDATLDFSNAGVRATLESDFRNFVDDFRNHPAVLAWAIGNEVNLGVTVAHSHWYSLANVLAAAAHDEEGSTYHPTLIVNGGLSHLGDSLHGSDDVSLSDVDLWGINGYFGDDDQCYFDYYGRLSSKPVLMTEFGVDAYDNNVSALDEQAQADWGVLQWRIIEAKTLGGTVMEYSDEWWKAGNPESHGPGGFVRDAMNDRFSNEEYWGVVSIGDGGGACNDVTPRLVYAALRSEWFTPGVPALTRGGLALLALLLTAGGGIVSLRLHGRQARG
jgi:hypothetical protein